MVTETDSFEFIEYFLLYDPSSLHVLFGIRCETDKMRSVERNRDESPHSKVDHCGFFAADVCSRKYQCLNKQLGTFTCMIRGLRLKLRNNIYLQETPNHHLDSFQIKIFPL